MEKIIVLSKIGSRNTDLVTEDDRRALRKTVGQANWASRLYRPDVSFYLMELSMKFNCPQKMDLGRANKVIDRLQTQAFSILFPKLSDPKKIVTYSDASYGNLIDGVLCGHGHIIFLSDDNSRSAPLACTEKKVRCVITSTLAAEDLSLHD